MPGALPVRDLATLLDDAAPARFGGKALGLARAARTGVQVPRGLAVAAGTTGDAGVARLVEAVLGELVPSGALAVRSSGIAEDGAVDSLAGRFISMVPVEREALWSAVRAVAASGPPGEVAVLVHEHVPALEQGVAFSRDPRPGSTGAVVERWRPGDQAPRVERLRAGTDAVHEALLDALARLTRALGTSLDVEWAFSGHLTILQVRPVTAVGHAAAEAFESAFAGDPNRWTLDGEHNPAPLSPAQAALCALVSGAPGVGELRVACGFLFSRAADHEALPTIAIDAGIARCEETLALVEQAPSLPAIFAAYREFAIAYAALGRALSEPRHRLLSAARSVAPDVEALAVAATAAVGARDRDLHEVALGQRSLEAHLAQFGAFSPTWDVASVTFGEDARTLGPVALPDASGPAAARAALATRAPTLGPLIDTALAAARLREDDDVLFARAQAAVRRMLLAVARARGLEPPEDVFWVAPLMLAALSNDEVRRLAEDARSAQRPGVLPPREIIAGRAVWPAPASRAVSGFGTGGRAQGHVVHLGDLTAAPEPRVLVTETITPALGHHLRGLAGLVVEHGGPLGHAAIQARERGLPAVVGAAGAMALQVGCLVVVDADEGLVYLPGGTAGSVRGAGSRL